MLVAAWKLQYLTYNEDSLGGPGLSPFCACILVSVVATHIVRFSQLFLLVSESKHADTENSFKISATDIYDRKQGVDR